MNDNPIVERIKTLIVYASKYGNTASIAVFIGRCLEQQGLHVQIINMRKNDVPDVSKFDVVLLGSGIVIAKWYKGIMKFLRNNETNLAQKVVAYFIPCASVVPPCDRETSYRIYTERARLYSKIVPAAFGIFGCDFSHAKSQGLLHKFTMPVLLKSAVAKGVDASNTTDFRDWKASEAWTLALVKIIHTRIPVAEVPP